jgi:hypothetical protein
MIRSLRYVIATYQCPVGLLIRFSGNGVGHYANISKKPDDSIASGRKMISTKNRGCNSDIFQVKQVWYKELDSKSSCEKRVFLKQKSVFFIYFRSSNVTIYYDSCNSIS